MLVLWFVLETKTQTKTHNANAAGHGPALTIPSLKLRQYAFFIQAVDDHLVGAIDGECVIDGGVFQPFEAALEGLGDVQNVLEVVRGLGQAEGGYVPSRVFQFLRLCEWIAQVCQGAGGKYVWNWLVVLYFWKITAPFVYVEREVERMYLQLLRSPEVRLNDVGQAAKQKMVDDGHKCVRAIARFIFERRMQRAVDCLRVFVRRDGELWQFLQTSSDVQVKFRRALAFENSKVRALGALGVWRVVCFCRIGGCLACFACFALSEDVVRDVGWGRWDAGGPRARRPA